jgi:hypothetical protein
MSDFVSFFATLAQFVLLDRVTLDFSLSCSVSKRVAQLGRRATLLNDRAVKVLLSACWLATRGSALANASLANLNAHKEAHRLCQDVREDVILGTPRLDLESRGETPCTLAACCNVSRAPGAGALLWRP